MPPTRRRGARPATGRAHSGATAADGRPLPPGGVGAPVPVALEQVGPLLQAAARRAAAPDGRGDGPAAVVWREGADALVVLLDRIGVRTTDGGVLVIVPVACDQLPDLRGSVVVSFAVGSPARPAGLVAAAGAIPQGPDVVVGRWGEALTALAWQALLDVVAGVAGASGRDLDGSPLVPASMTATDQGLTVLPQARHPFDRLTTTSAVAAPAGGSPADALLRTAVRSR